MKKSTNEIYRDKSEYIERNGIKLYFCRYFKPGKSTIEEMLIGILLSNLPLEECTDYHELNDIIASSDVTDFSFNPAQNYALLTIFSATRYINDAYGEDSEISARFRDRMRRYTANLDNSIINKNVIIIDRDSKVKIKN